MKIFEILANGVLRKRSLESTIENIDLSSPVVELVKSEKVIFKSDDITTISSDDCIDATDLLNVQKYLNNVRLLVDEARSKNAVDKFAIIREDDCFPYNWEWRVASGSTSAEYGNCNFTYEIRMAKAEEMIGQNKNILCINIPVDDKELFKAASSIDPVYGRIIMPSQFRSTKHFTINTPLEYTGSYNSGISSNRKFIVIDDISNFINSGYGYSANYMDAYLDITHENLPISNKAIVLISEDDYEDVMKDSTIRDQLCERRVIKYKGDVALAINMVLSENGILPSRPGGVYGYYSDDVQNILENSMRKLCYDNNLLYSKGHGNINGVGGHFTDLYDSMYIDSFNFSLRFSKFLRNYFPEYASKISDDVLNKPGDVVKMIGPDKLNGAILLFNDIEKKRVAASRKKYDRDRDMLSSDNRELFVDTVSLINRFYSDDEVRNNDLEIRDSIKQFFHSEDVDTQVYFAKVINSYIQKKLDEEDIFIL